MADAPQPPRKDKDKENPWVTVAKYSHLALALPASTIAGWLIGAGLDRWLGTDWINVAGLIVGVIAGFVEMGRIILRQSREQ